MRLQSSGEIITSHSIEGYPGVYLILREANFREQIKTAVKLVRAAAREKLFKRKSRLLIIGGGVSGLAAGLEAAERGLVVTLLESEETLLSVQGGCHTRYLHPYEYYWPLPHYKEPKFPFLKEDKNICHPLMYWRAGVASQISRKIANRIEAKKPSNLTLILGANHIPVSLETLYKDFDPDGEFEFILICAGGQERREIGNFASFKYWENDPLETITTDSKLSHIKKVLISGGGDGGLQDLLRILHNPQKGRLFSAGNLIRRLLPTLENCPQFKKWVKTKERDPKSMRPAPETMSADLNNLFDLMELDAASWKDICHTVLKNINPVVARGELSVQLIFKDPIFSNAFALNAFLIQLVSRVLNYRIWFCPNQGCKLILSSTARHRCSKKAEKCCGRQHEVFFKVNGPRERPPEKFDLIVLRHGSDHAVSPVAKALPSEK